MIEKIRTDNPKRLNQFYLSLKFLIKSEMNENFNEMKFYNWFLFIYFCLDYKMKNFDLKFILDSF